ncbi:hypothetical protein [Chryseobacterium sp. GVT01B]|uniref:hypothetical protein n=1 Tax=Chryseobacterium sp. GVT01B TaxID=2862675 RepID=UPI001CBCBE05|nr:hypothetical protein [Chryseobacterium sp. GVT01B]
MIKPILTLLTLISFFFRCKENHARTIDIIKSQYRALYFDDDNIKDKAVIKAKQNTELSSFILYIYLSSLNKTVEIPILNNSILYNNTEADYYLSDPIIKNKIITIRVDYADQITKPNISGERKNLIEKIKFRFDTKNKKIQVIGYDLSYTKAKKIIQNHLILLQASFILHHLLMAKKKKHLVGLQNFKTYTLRI